MTNVSLMLSVKNDKCKPYMLGVAMLSVVKLSVVMLSVVAPIKSSVLVAVSAFFISKSFDRLKPVFLKDKNGSFGNKDYGGGP
jgi:hypothetical protein